MGNLYHANAKITAAHFCISKSSLVRWSHRFYRQPFLGDWQGMIDLVQADLRDWLFNY